MKKLNRQTSCVPLKCIISHFVFRRRQLIFSSQKEFFKWKQVKITNMMVQRPEVNFSPMSPKLVRTIVENQGITMAPLFLRLITWKSPPQSIKIFVKLDSFINVLVVWFVFVYTEIYWDNSWLHQKWSYVLVLTVAKVWILDWLERTFSWYQPQKWWCHCNSPVFHYIYVVKFGRVWVT